MQRVQHLQSGSAVLVLVHAICGWSRWEQELVVDLSQVVLCNTAHMVTSLEVLEKYSTWVALGLANIANMSDPDTIVIGGGVMENADILLPRIQDRFATMLYAPSHRVHPVLKSAQLGERAGAIGAALLHLHD